MMNLLICQIFKINTKQQLRHQLCIRAFCNMEELDEFLRTIPDLSFCYIGRNRYSCTTHLVR